MEAKTHITTTPIKKIAYFTDIHFGRRNSSIVHLQDCLDYLTWFLEDIKKDPEITHIGFLGDWFETRSAISVLTLAYSHRGMKMIADAGLEALMIIGNHDLHQRHNRDIHSMFHAGEYKNITLIDHPTIVNDQLLFCPFIFPQEYAELVKYNNLPYFAGHFEFKNFIVTGTAKTMDHGPDHKYLSGPTYIFSGHYHKRQAKDNVIFIGNCFNMDYGDAGDTQRGYCVHDLRSDDVYFIDWPQTPLYLKTSLSAVVTENFSPPPKTRVRCLVDLPMSYTEAQVLKIDMIETFNLREFVLEENVNEKKEALSESTDADYDVTELSTVNEMVLELLGTVNSTVTIKPVNLIEIYKTL